MCCALLADSHPSEQLLVLIDVSVEEVVQRQVAHQLQAEHGAQTDTPTAAPSDNDTTASALSFHVNREAAAVHGLRLLSEC